MKRTLTIFAGVLVLLLVGTSLVIASGVTVESIHDTTAEFDEGSISGNIDTSNDTIYWEPESATDTATYVSQTHTGEATQGIADVEVSGFNGAKVSVRWQYLEDGSWKTYDTQQVTDDEVATTNIDSEVDTWRVRLVFSIDGDLLGEDDSVTVNSEGYKYESNNPEVDNAQPDGEQIDNRQPTISFDVSDEDFDTVHVDEVDVDIYLNDDLAYSETVTEDGTVEWETSGVVGGTNEWYVTAEDEVGNQITTETYTFDTPSELEIRNESAPSELVTGTEVDVIFFTDEEAYERTTTDGTIDLEGLPIDEEFTVQISADGFVTREAIIRSVFEQQAVYALPEDVDTVETKFTLDDPTGTFSQENSRVFVKRAVDSGDGLSYETIVADDLGVDGYTTTLEKDQRYVIEVENKDTGEIRRLGPYVASISEQVTLKVDNIQFSYVDEGLGYQWGGEYINDSGQESVRFSFAMIEDEDQFESLSVQIYQRGDETNILLDESYQNQNSITDIALVPENIEGEQNKTFVIEWEATIDGETVKGSDIVGPDQIPVGVEGVPDDVMKVVSVFLILIVGGLFSVANVEIGAIVVSLFSGLMWIVGFLPGSVSGILIATALLLSVIMYTRTSGGGPQ